MGWDRNSSNDVFKSDEIASCPHIPDTYKPPSFILSTNALSPSVQDTVRLSEEMECDKATREVQAHIYRHRQADILNMHVSQHSLNEYSSVFTPTQPLPNYFFIHADIGAQSQNQNPHHGAR